MKCFSLSFLYSSSLYLVCSKIVIIPFGKFHRIEGGPPETFPNVMYDAPEEVGGNKKCLVEILYVNSSRALSLCSLNVFCCR